MPTSEYCVLRSLDKRALLSEAERHLSNLRQRPSRIREGGLRVPEDSIVTTDVPDVATHGSLQAAVARWVKSYGGGQDPPLNLREALA